MAGIRRMIPQPLKLQQAKTELSDGVLSGEETLFNLDTEVLRGLLKG